MEKREAKEGMKGNDEESAHSKVNATLGAT